jgi:hypothetical protein
MTVDHQIFVSTLGAKIVKLDGSKKGKVEWEADLERPAASAPGYVPGIHNLSVIDAKGTLTVIDAKTGKAEWKYAIENKNPLLESWALRLKGQYIEELGMDWSHKGWTVWAPCFESKMCAFTPKKGQLIERVPVHGSIIGLPLQVDRRLVFLTQKPNGQLIVSHVLEENESKKLKGTAGGEGSSNPN